MSRSAEVLLNKVPQVTIFFWIIKILATTVGETTADLLVVHLGLGLTLTTMLMSMLLVTVLTLQFWATGYVPCIYWLAVVLISVVGTLVADCLVDNLGMTLSVTTAVLSVALAVTFLAWRRAEGTLSIHSIDTPRREAFYWMVILFTFALGAAAGDLIVEGFDIGYWQSSLLFIALITAVVIARIVFHLNEVLTFWLAYILTQPLGASLGDYFSQPTADGGLGLGTTVTGVVFLLAILGVVVYLAITKTDAEPVPIE